jgi:hypothetical protein
MTKCRLITVLTALFALAIPATASAADELDPVQWQTGGPKTATKFDIYNQVNKGYLGYESRTFGPDLGWESKLKYADRWMFTRPRINGVVDNRPDIKPDEKVALYSFSAKQYLVYKSNKTGINLGWSKTASYQWKLAFKYSTASLYNTEAGDYVVYGKRTWGINLQWLKDRRKAEENKNANAVGTVHDASVTMTAQPVVQGFVPFLGWYGGGTNAVLTKVANPSNGAPLDFVKPGRSTTECGNRDAVMRLSPGQTMTADQMKTLWASATPSLVQRLPFLACAVTQYSTVWVNVQYRITG